MLWKFKQVNANFFKAFGYATLSGLIGWFSFNYNWLWFFVFVAILPLLHVHYNLKLKAWQHFFVGFVAGTIMLGGAMIWHWNLLPADWAGIDNKLHGFLMVLYVWGFSAILGGLKGFWSLGARFLKRNSLYDFLLLPSLWIIIDYITSFSTSLLWSGPGALVGPYWSIGFLGYTLASSKIFLPLASIGGIYFLTFVVIDINLIIFFILRSFIKKTNWKKYLISIPIILLLVIMVGTPFYLDKSNIQSQQTKVALVNTYFPSFSLITTQEFYQKLRDKKDLLQKIKDDGQAPDIVIFPEDSRVLFELDLTGDTDFLKEVFGDQEILLIDSSRTSKIIDEYPRLQFSFLNNKTDELVKSDKVFLIPHGEYLPYLTDSFIKLSGLQEWADGFRSRRQSSRGKQINLVEFKDFSVGATVCSENMSTTINSSIVKAGSAFIVNVASHSLFRGSELLYGQIQNIAKVRAVENDRFFVQSSNFVPSFIVDNKGQLITASDWGVNSVTYQNVGVIRATSIYNKFGWFILPTLAITFLIYSFYLKINIFRFFNRKDKDENENEED